MKTNINNKYTINDALDRKYIFEFKPMNDKWYFFLGKYLLTKGLTKLEVLVNSRNVIARNRAKFKQVLLYKRILNKIDELIEYEN